MTNEEIKDEAMAYCRKKFSCWNESMVTMLCGFAAHLQNGSNADVVRRADTEAIKENKKLKKQIRELKAELKSMHSMVDDPERLADYIMGS